MNVTITAQTVITAAALLTAIGAIIAMISRALNFVKRQEEQDKLIKSILDEQTILTQGMLACLKGLQEQGCNGPVTEAIRAIEQHLNEEAHRT